MPMTNRRGKAIMRQLGLAIAIICVLLHSDWEANAQTLDTSDSSEYLIKAGFIYNFAKFVGWPTTAFAEPNSPIVIGIFGNDPFGAILDRIVNDKKIDGRGFAVKRLKWGKDLKDCNILFISSSEKAHLQEVIQIVKGMPVLTIGETPNFARRGGIINFTLEDSKVRFEVNIEAARQADLNISSRLLSLARIVQEDVAYGRKTQ
jgi:hypothetical protein